MKKSISGMAAVAVLILLLCNPVLSYEGAKRGLLLWSQTILPSLLPFMICSNMIVAWDAMHLLTFPLRPLLHQVMRLSDGGSYILIAGLLCGYPMGAKTCSEFLEDRQITSAEGAYLLSISNHPSPMFLLGYVASGLDQHLSIVWILIALYLPILPISLLSRRIYGISKPCKSSKASTKEKSSFDFTMMNSIEVMVKIGGYIMLFSILANFLQVLPMHVHATKAILLGFVEITTGIQSISSEMEGLQQAFWIVAITAFGGLSGIFQTKSVLKNAGLSIRHYIMWKLLHSLLSCLIFILLRQMFLPVH